MVLVYMLFMLLFLTQTVSIIIARSSTVRYDECCVCAFHGGIPEKESLYPVTSGCGILYYTMATFKVDDVVPETKPLRRANLEEIIKKYTGGAKPESFFKLSKVPVVTYDNDNAFVTTVNTAYDQHYPLVLSPDAIWMLIAQGFAQHVNANSDKLRGHFVEHEGKKELIVRRDDFIKGCADNPWPEVFDSFSDQIRSHVGPKVHSMLTPEFTTTGPTEKAASQVVLMDTFKEYFDYTVWTGCGIPEITLEGTVDDWKKLRDKALGLVEYDLAWWIDALKPVLDEFVNAASGKIDKKFWSKIYKGGNMSGSPYIHGWIITFFPYIRSGENFTRNGNLKNWNDDRFLRVTSSSFSHGIVSTPFKWEYLGTAFPMHFYAGFMAMTQDPDTLALRPEIGWAVVDNEEEEAKRTTRAQGWF